MRFSRLFLAAALTLGAMTLGSALMPATAAVAQEVATTKVSLAPVADSVLGYVSATISALLAGGLAILGARIYALTGINIEARHREALHSAIMTGVNAGLGKVSDLIGGQAIDVRSTAVAEGVSYVLAAVPDAVKFFGLSPAHLSEMVAAKFTQLRSSTPVPLLLRTAE